MPGTSDVDPDTLANLGPLRRLAGRWRAPKGVDLNLKTDGPERRVFIERIDFDLIDPQTNGPHLCAEPARRVNANVLTHYPTERG